jgi:hypothetical protein
LPLSQWRFRPDLNFCDALISRCPHLLYSCLVLFDVLVDQILDPWFGAPAVSPWSLGRFPYQCHLLCRCTPDVLDVENRDSLGRICFSTTRTLTVLCGLHFLCCWCSDQSQRLTLALFSCGTSNLSEELLHPFFGLPESSDLPWPASHDASLVASKR